MGPGVSHDLPRKFAAMAETVTRSPSQDREALSPRSLKRQQSDISVQPATSAGGRCVDAFVKQLVRRPCTVALTTLAVSIGLSVVVVMAVLGSDSDFFSSVQPPDMDHSTSPQMSPASPALRAERRLFACPL